MKQKPPPAKLAGGRAVSAIGDRNASASTPKSPPDQLAITGWSVDAQLAVEVERKAPRAKGGRT